MESVDSTSEECPQCKKIVNNTTNRLIQDTCGHKKCRSCLLQDDLSCKLCYLHTVTVNVNKNIPNISVIKYEDSHKTEVDKLNLSTLMNTGTSLNNTETINDPPDKTDLLIDSDADNRKSKRQYRKLTIPSHVTVVTKNPLLYQCTACKKSFRTSTNIKYHLYCTGLEKPLKCTDCGKGFISRSHLSTHSLIHQGMRPFICTVCDKSFLQKSKLNRHMKLHTGDLQYICSECGKKFTNKDGLNSHYRTHTGDRPFSCNQCGSKFSNKSNLTKHIATHSKERLFMCEQCGKKFKTKPALEEHKKKHFGKRIHACSHCQKSFISRKDLKRHAVVHEDSKPYQCHMCTTKFRRKDNLERHIKNTHSSYITQQKTKSVSVIKIDESKTKTDNKTSTAEINLKSLCTSVQKQQEDFQEKPNAINVIKSSNETIIASQHSSKKIQPSKNAVPVINGPFKLAFKTDKFKHNYNIHNRDYVDSPPHIQSVKSYNLAESLNICQRILSPMNSTTLNDTVPEGCKNIFHDQPKNAIIMNVGQVNEKDSLEICKKILSPIDVTTLHYETSFENKKHASIKNIKFKLPSTYTEKATKSSTEKNDKLLNSDVITTESDNILKNNNKYLSTTSTLSLNLKEKLPEVSSNDNEHFVSHDNLKLNNNLLLHSDHRLSKSIHKHLHINDGLQDQSSNNLLQSHDTRNNQLDSHDGLSHSSDSRIIHITDSLQETDIRQHNTNDDMEFSYEISEGNNSLRRIPEVLYNFECNNVVEYTELQPAKLNSDNNFETTYSEGFNEHQSVIVNPHMSVMTGSDKNLLYLSDKNINNAPPFNEMHWRKRTSQISQPDNV